jgi:peptidoglycan hydrolase-like protein with peptidoglycan-binding domain
MSFELTWLPEALLAANLKVATVPGWENRGRASMGTVRGVLCHHTAGPATGNMPTLRTLVEGRSNLAGPLAQLGLGRDGTFYVVAAGRCNHAGTGRWDGVGDGNANLIGVEAENSGTPRDPWPEVQLAAYAHGVAAILAHARLGAERCIGHKEWAPRRKTDPTFDMTAFRDRVRDILAGQAEPLRPIPAVEPDGAHPRPTLRRGSTGDAVSGLQRALGLGADGVFGAQTEAAVRSLQRQKHLVPDGIVGPITWQAAGVAAF